MPHGDGPFVWPLATDPEKPLAPEMVRRRGKKYAKRANIEKGFWPHACRHTAASTFLAAGVPLNVVASWMGHSVLTLTKVYAHLAPEVSQRLMAGLDFDDDGEVEVEAAE
jgi:site-specific recombinase XerD